MGQVTSISWTHHTFNPWWGCEKVSPACRGCYAERDAKRWRPDVSLWGPGSVRQVAGDRTWREPLKWARAARAAGERRRVFCASMADVFEGRSDLDEPRARLWGMIRATPELDWLLLTKRPENVARMVPSAWLEGVDRRRLVAAGWPTNVWLGTTVEDQEHAAKRIPELLRVPARTRFLSVEPLLERLPHLDRFFWMNGGSTAGPWIDALGRHRGGGGPGGQQLSSTPSGDIAWVIVGGESGPNARPMHPDWVREIRDACTGEVRYDRPPGVAFHFKQWGEWCPSDGDAGDLWLFHDGQSQPWTPGSRGAEPGRWALGGDALMVCAGKKLAGRELDGRTWDEFPAQAVPG